MTKPSARRAPVSEPQFDASLREALDRDGYVVLHDILDKQSIAAIRLRVDELLASHRGDPSRKHGGTVHVDDLVEDPICRPVTANARIADVFAHLLGSSYHVPRLHFRAPQPGYGAQTLHTDAVGPTSDGYADAATAIVSLTAFTLKNGATCVVPGSHRVPRERASGGADANRAVVVTAPAGSAIVFHGHLLHGGTRNESTARRDALQLSAVRSGVAYFSGATPTKS